MEESPAVSGNTKFSDVQNSKYYYYNAVKWASDKGIVSGYDNGEFLPENIITRAEAAAIINRALGRKMTSEIFRDVT